MSLAAKVQEFDSNRARQAANWLVKNMTLPPFVGTEEFAVDLRANVESHVRWLNSEPSGSKAVEYFASDILQAKQNNCPLGDPPLVFNAAAMLYLLLIAYESAKAEAGILSCLERAHDATLRVYLDTVSEQADVFCAYLQQVAEFLSKMAISNARVVLVDMPVGNTLGVRLLEGLLRHTCHLEVMQVALQRNASRSKGPTRQQLLEEKLEQLALTKNNIVLYFDEWGTGSNFNAMCKILAKRIPERAFFFPFAVLTQDSGGFNRYASFCEDHDGLIQKWGRSGKDFRKVLPPVKSVSRGNGYFFWAEKDRMAGVRKLQVHGALFSSIDATIESLHADQSALTLALGFQLADFVAEGLLKEDQAKNIGALRSLFEEGYADYQTCREEFRNCADAGTEVESTDALSEALAALSPQYSAVFDGRKAKIAVMMAFNYSKRFGSLDPEDRYYFQTHAPVVMPLSGRAARVFDVTFEFLNQRLEAFHGHATDRPA